MEEPTAIILPPPVPRLHPRAHSPSPSRSPTRPRLTDDILSDLSPATTLEAFTNASGALRASIEAATPTQRAFGIRAAIASKKIQEWVTELAEWPWPTGSSSEGFASPVAKRRKLDDDGGREGRLLNGTAHQSADSEKGKEEEEYWGSLPAKDVMRYEERIEEIEEDMEDLNVEEIKRTVLDTHVLPKSRPSSPNPGATPPPLSKSYTRMGDFTAVVTATVLQALPNLSRLMALMDIWSVRLLVLHQLSPLLLSLSDAEMAIKSGWNTLDQFSSPVSDADEASTLSRENFEVMRDVLQEKVTVLGQKIDRMLDTLEGREETVPEGWLDRIEAIEQDYGEWVVSGDRKVRQGEWAKELARRKAQKLTAIPEDAVVESQPLEEAVPEEDALVVADEEPAEVSKSTVEDITHPPAQIDESEDAVAVAIEEPIELPKSTVADIPHSPEPIDESDLEKTSTSPTAIISSFDGAQDQEPASIALDTFTPDGAPLGHGSISDSSGYFSPTDIIASQLPRTDLVKEVNKTDPLQDHGFDLPSIQPHEPVALVPQTESVGLISSSREDDGKSALPSTTPPLENSNTAVTSPPLPVSPKGNGNLPIKPKLPRFGHPLANILRASSSQSELQSESVSTEADQETVAKSIEEHDQVTAVPATVTVDTTTHELASESPVLVAETVPEKVDEPAPLPAVVKQDPPMVPGDEETPNPVAVIAEASIDEDAKLGAPSPPDQSQLRLQDLGFLTPSKVSPPVLQSTGLQWPQVTHSRQISTSSTISGYSMSDPSPEICEAATEYFSPIVSPVKQSHDTYLIGDSVTPTDSSFLGTASSPVYAEEERPETPRPKQNVVDAVPIGNSSVPIESQRPLSEIENLVDSPSLLTDATEEVASVAYVKHTGSRPEIVPIINQTPTETFVRSQTPEMPIEPQSPLIDEKLALSFTDFEEQSPSIGRVRIYGEGNDYSPQSSPPPIPPMSNRRSLHVQVDTYDDESLSSQSPLSPNEPSFLANLDVLPTQNMSTPSKVSDDQLQQQISSILESIPARIRLTSEPDTEYSSRSELRPGKQRPSLGAGFRPLSRPQSRAATPSFTLAPAYALNKTRRTRPQSGKPEIKLYHLSRSTGEAPIKLFVRLVGEHGERVMVRVGGGWADLGEYLKEYAAHHGRRAASGAEKGEMPKDKVEIQDLPPRTISGGSVASFATIRNGNVNGRSSPNPYNRSPSSLERPMSGLGMRKTRRSVGEEDRGFSYRSPSTPLPMRSMSRQGTPMYETPPPRSSSRLSWAEEDSSLGLAGPKARKVDISPENAAWVESMKEKVRLASAEKDRDREKERVQRERRVSGANSGEVGTGGFGEMGKAGATKRLFKKSLGGGGV